jgi:hypothetical protein
MRISDYGPHHRRAQSARQPPTSQRKMLNYSSRKKAVEKRDEPGAGLLAPRA